MKPQMYATLLRLSLILLVMSILSGLTACLQKPTPQPEIRIGVITTLSGDLEPAYGTPLKNASELAVKEINDAGGLEVNGKKYKIVLLYEDDQDKAEAATAAAQKLIRQENVVAIVGAPLSRNAIPVSDVAENSQIPMISVKSSNPKTTAGKQYAFRAVFLDPFQGSVLAQFAAEDLSAKKAAVLYDIASTYNKTVAEVFKQEFEARGGQVVAFESYTTDQNTDFSQQLGRIKDSGAEVVLLPNYVNDIKLQVSQARQLGITATLIGSDSWKPEQIAALPEFDGSYFVEVWAPELSSEKSQAFTEAYRSAYNTDPTTISAITYDVFGLLFSAIQKQGKVESEAIRDGIANYGRYTGVTGDMAFSGSGDPLRSAVIIQINDGKAALFKQVNP